MSIALLVLLALVGGALLAAAQVARLARDDLRRAERERDEALAAGASSTQQAARLERALCSVPLGVVLLDHEGTEVLRTGLAAEVVDARHAEVLVEDAVQAALTVARRGTPHSRDVDLLGPPRRVLVVSALPIEAGTLAFVEDVSERRRLEAIRRDFVANVSHELKTPVGALGLLAETLQDEDDPAVTRRLAERMTAEALRVGRIIDDLLALSAIEVDEHHVRQPVPVRDVVDEAASRLAVSIATREIVLDTDGVGAEVVVGDRTQLVSALANLLENACKYSEGGSAVEVTSAVAGDDVEIRVRDHGIGIPASDLERVFERFYRVDRARSRATGGTGLGLAIVRHVAANHGGEVRVESREGLGSTFTLRLPRKELG
jgi:two-component system, OmpR family, sensor histidine kinase SenX3